LWQLSPFSTLWNGKTAVSFLEGWTVCYLTMYSTNNNLQIQLLLACLYISSHNIFYDNTTVPKTLNYQIIRIMASAYSSCIEVYL